LLHYAAGFGSYNSITHACLLCENLYEDTLGPGKLYIQFIACFSLICIVCLKNIPDLAILRTVESSERLSYPPKPRSLSSVVVRLNIVFQMRIVSELSLEGTREEAGMSFDPVNSRGTIRIGQKMMPTSVEASNLQTGDG
jgi:hypothetical protein